jgi:hypothetical protein
MFERDFASTMGFCDDIFVDVPTTYAAMARRHVAAELYILWCSWTVSGFNRL